MVALLSGGGRVACSLLSDEEGGTRDSISTMEGSFRGGWIADWSAFLDMHVFSLCRRRLVP